MKWYKKSIEHNNSFAKVNLATSEFDELRDNFNHNEGKDYIEYERIYRNTNSELRLLI